MGKKDNKKNNNVKIKILWSIRTMCIIGFFVAATYIVMWGISSIENRNLVDNVKENEFEEFVKTLKERSIKDFGIEVTWDDKILTLSTCDNTYTKRIVLHAKKIME